jgi:hypothetical protein
MLLTCSAVNIEEGAGSRQQAVADSPKLARVSVSGVNLCDGLVGLWTVRERGSH